METQQPLPLKLRGGKNLKANDGACFCKGLQNVPWVPPEGIDNKMKKVVCPVHGTAFFLAPVKKT
jgi:hypothetical protein